MRIITLFFLLGILCISTSLNAQDPDFGDAPDGVIAYPSSGVIGHFPTCSNLIHGTISGTFPMHFGDTSSVDTDSSGNGGDCNFTSYDIDECFNDGDAGLMFPDVYTIVNNQVVPCPNCDGGTFGSPNTSLTWGTDLDIIVYNPINPTHVVEAYVNILFDWDQNGKWDASEHVLKDFLIPETLPVALSSFNPPSFMAGPNAGLI